ncbi:S-adenosyl-L-methionine-dependent methyltransferase [Wolfiporia cocos MD-104 SS10]|uniref:S-adenosyl-L-methionine-dependent methyltransferase n=1 Tax=Wolfiporia cocos (strain MD-104) TaxID=742152 RepID=A0A2H3JVR1_WOLCO|nr:S-adenosyl-L-methionine-dependent methyltransferase [Wolfiporia cocos MD-104 SS10]
MPQIAQIALDGRVSEGIQHYSTHWQIKDLSEDNNVNSRVEEYADVVNGYYDGATELYEYGWARSFHFCRFYKGEAFAAALARSQHYLAAKMSLRPGMRVLDVGCGVGGPAQGMARFVNVQVVGVNINEFQLGRAVRYTREAGLEEQVSFIKADFMKLSKQFEEGSFDAVYAIGATVHAPTWEGVYGEIFKVLKPGGTFGVYEWAMTEAWDPSLPSHKELAHKIEIGSGIPEMRPLRKAREALLSVGFSIKHEEDLAEYPDEVPWYYPLEGKLSNAQTAWDLVTVWRNTWSGKIITHCGLWVAEKLGMVPKGTWDVGETMRIAAEGLVEGGKRKSSRLTWSGTALYPYVSGDLSETGSRVNSSSTSAFKRVMTL